MSERAHAMLNRDEESTGPGPSPASLAQMQAAIDRAVRGVRDPASVRSACDRMDRMRDEMRQRVGDVEVAVTLIREGRDE